MTRRGKRLAGCTLVAAAAIAHGWYWYAPRLRPVPAPSTGISDGVSELPTRLWMPFPHQNLAALESEVGQVREALVAVVEAGGERSLLTGGFGPFPAPPSRQVVVGTDERGRLRIELDLYLGLAAVARAAGTLASNPWLEGGEVVLDGISGRVDWDDTVWTLDLGSSSGRVTEGGETDRLHTPGPPALGVVELATGRDPAPAGRYELVETDEGFLLATTDAALRAVELPALTPEVALLWLRRRGELSVLGISADGAFLELPSAAVVGSVGTQIDLEKHLPLGDLLSALDRLPRRTIGEVEVVATDHEAVEIGARWAAEELGPWRRQRRIEGAVVARIEPARRWALEAAGVADAVAVLDRAGAARWERLISLLEAVEGTERLEGWIGIDGSAAVRLVTR